MLVFAQGACTSDLLGGDTCNTLCQETARRLAGCIDEWGVDWPALGASSRDEFRTQCQSEWDDTRSALEPRQVKSAQEECTTASNDLADETCDDLRALYL